MVSQQANRYMECVFPYDGILFNMTKEGIPTQDTYRETQNIRQRERSQIQETIYCCMIPLIGNVQKKQTGRHKTD